MKVSKHAKYRMRQRTPLNHRERRQFFRLAMKHGKYVGEIKNERIKAYLAPKQKYNSRIVLYQDYVFVYSRNSHQLYTMYKLPDELLESEMIK